jgi:hypothetical protein
VGIVRSRTQAMEFIIIIVIIIIIIMAVERFCWALAVFSVSQSYRKSVSLLGLGISPSQGLYLRTYRHACLLWVPIRAGEDGSCLRPRGHSHRPSVYV